MIRMKAKVYFADGREKDLENAYTDDEYGERWWSVVDKHEDILDEDGRLNIVWIEEEE